MEWWSTFLRDSRGTGFWHETYFLRGGMEAIYEDLPGPLGLLAFAPAIPAKQAMFSARRRLGFGGEEHLVPVLSEGRSRTAPSADRGVDRRERAWHEVT
jgi:hypothetical protein